MIDRQYGKIIWECDVCDETLETGESEFGDAMKVFHDSDWLAEKVDGEWLHTCLKCQ